MSTIHVPEQEVCVDVLQEKYCNGDEKNIDDVRKRIAKGLVITYAELNKIDELATQYFKNDEDVGTSKPIQIYQDHCKLVDKYDQFYETLCAGFIPGGRINSTVGTDLNAVAINCFVLPVGDSISEDKPELPSIYNAVKIAAETMRKGGGVGYNFSNIRPHGAIVHKTNSYASGSLSYMNVFDASCETVQAAGLRRGAQMGVLRVDHPDIFEFIVAKDGGKFTNFNLSVGITDSFMQAVELDLTIELWHEAEPSSMFFTDYYKREDGNWCYKKIAAREIWNLIMERAYNHGEPGILFLDTINEDNNLHYIEHIEATNPCGEQALPPYGCCDLGSIDITKFVVMPFEPTRCFIDMKKLTRVIHSAVEMLDLVLDYTQWPIKEYGIEAKNKRRIGLGPTGIGSALSMLCCPYDSEEAIKYIEEIGKLFMEESIKASIKLAEKYGPFPLFDADKYLESGYMKKVSSHLRDSVRTFGVRNSHTLSVQPVGTGSLAFANNASNGIEPAFELTYYRKKRLHDGAHKEYKVFDYAALAYLVYSKQIDNVELHNNTFEYLRSLDLSKFTFPDYFKTALKIDVDGHLGVLTTMAYYINGAISKTLNIPADYPYEDFKHVYMKAWKANLKGLATYRPNSVLGAVLSTTSQVVKTDTKPVIDGNTRHKLSNSLPVLRSLKSPDRPILPKGNPCWTYMVKTDTYKFAMFIGNLPDINFPFEVWVNGPKEPRGLGAVAKILSLDMRVKDRKWLKLKLNQLKGNDGTNFVIEDTPLGESKLYSSILTVFSDLVNHRCEEIGAYEDHGSPKISMEDYMLIKTDPSLGTEGTLAWTVNVDNHVTEDSFILGLREADLNINLNGKDTTITVPYKVWLSGNYPRALDGLAKLLSYDMKVSDFNWIGMKLVKLLNYSEPLGDFMATVPGSVKKQNYPSTVAYIAALILHRYITLGILNPDGTSKLGESGSIVEEKNKVTNDVVTTGTECPECHNFTLVKRDGCKICTDCGYMGACG